MVTGVLPDVCAPKQLLSSPAPLCKKLHLARWSWVRKMFSLDTVQASGRHPILEPNDFVCPADVTGPLACLASHLPVSLLTGDPGVL